MMLCGLWGERTTDKVKLLRQFLVIMAVSFIGEILHAVLPLPIPACIYGLVLMLAVLVITLVSTIVVMIVSGRVTQAVIRLEKKHKGGDAK